MSEQNKKNVKMIDVGTKKVTNIIFLIYICLQNQFRKNKYFCYY